MFLRDLFRYRTTAKENREDFLSACLAELMRRDPAACAAVLQAVGLSPPPLDRGHTVRTQVGRHHGKSMRWCDIMVDFAHGPPFILECKVGDAPKVAQLKLYQQIWDTPHVALLAPEATVPPADDPAWAGLARGSWQAVWEAIEGLAADPVHAEFRAALLDLMVHLELHGRPSCSAEERVAAAQALAAQDALRVPMRAAVLALLQPGLLPLQPSTGISQMAGNVARTA